MTCAEEIEKLFQQQRRTRQFLDFVQYDQMLEKFGRVAETKRVPSEPLDPENGKGFVTEFSFVDGSVWRTKQTYLVNDQDAIVFERRGE